MSPGRQLFNTRKSHTRPTHAPDLSGSTRSPPIYCAVFRCLRLRHQRLRHQRERLLIRQRGPAQGAASRANARDADHQNLPARAHRAPNPGSHCAGTMDNPCDRRAALRWGGGLTKTTIRCNAGMAKLPDSQDPPELLLALLKGARGYSSDFQNGARDLDAVLPFASIGADLDAGAVDRGGYAYRIRGAMCRRFGSTEPEGGAAPRYSRIYLFDAAEDTGFR